MRVVVASGLHGEQGRAMPPPSPLGQGPGWEEGREGQAPGGLGGGGEKWGRDDHTAYLSL